jgi:hypothetical protein
MKRNAALFLPLVLAVAGCVAGPTAATARPPRPLLAQAAPAPGAPTTSPPPAIATTNPSPQDSSGPPVPKAKAEDYPERDDRQLGRTWGWSLVSVGAAFGAIALGTSYLMLHDKSTEDSNCSNKVCNAEGINANGELAALGPWNLVTWVVGIAGAGAGVYLLVTHPSDKATGTQIEVTPTSSGAGLTLRRTF